MYKGLHLIRAIHSFRQSEIKYKYKQDPSNLGGNVLRVSKACQRLIRNLKEGPIVNVPELNAKQSALTLARRHCQHVTLSLKLIHVLFEVDSHTGDNSALQFQCECILADPLTLLDSTLTSKIFWR